MKIINKSKIPDVMFEYLKSDTYDYNPDTISATQLLKSTREYILTKRYNDKIEVDAADRLWQVLGSAVHSVLEQAELSKHQEERLFYEFKGFKISGKFDLLYRGRLTDFKCTSAFTVMFGSRTEEWIKQLSIYRWLYAKVKQITLPDDADIICIFRDWALRNIKPGSKYPDSPMITVSIKLMSLDKTEKFIEAKLKEIEVNNTLSDHILKPCTDYERWWNEKQKKYNKCDKYCVCNKFCSQYLDSIKTKDVLL